MEICDPRIMDAGTWDNKLELWLIIHEKESKYYNYNIQ